jgi:hypothetical protein
VSAAAREAVSPVICTLTRICGVNVHIARARGRFRGAASAIRAFPQCQPSVYAGASPDAGAVATATAPAATSRTASTKRRASDSSL